MVSADARLGMARLFFGWRPHPTQKQWMVDDARVKVAACGRRWGKTEAAAVDAATFALACPGSAQMIVAPTCDQSRLIFDTVERLVMGRAVTRRVSKVTRTPFPRLRINRSEITARTADDDGRNLRGHSADRVIVDEAAYVRDAVVEEVISPMLADRNGQLVMISTPWGKNHFYRAFARGNGGDGRYSAHRFPSRTNPFVSGEYIEFQRGVITPRQFSVEYEAEFLDDQASVFPWETIERAVGLGRETYVSDEPWLVAGVDWARYSDYTTVIVLDASETPHRVVAMDRFHKLSWEAQVERVASILIGCGVSEVLTDQTSIGDPLLEQLRRCVWEKGAGMAIEGMAFTNASKREIIDNLVVRLSAGETAIPDDEQLVRELQYFEYELTTSGNVRMNARSGYTDDLVVALALAEWQGKSAGGPARFLAGSKLRVASQSVS